MGLTASRDATHPLTDSTATPSDHSSPSLNQPRSAPDLCALHVAPTARPSASLPDSLHISPHPPSSPTAAARTPPSHTSPPRPAPPASASPSSSSDDALLLPTVFTWAFEAHSVHVSGSWDSWRAKTPLYQNGTEHLALLYLPVGEHLFKFFVDGAWHCAPNVPTAADRQGNTNNVLAVRAIEAEFDTPAALHDPAPPSPMSSYGTTTDVPDPPSVDAPPLPAQLDASALKPLPEDISPSVTAAAAAAVAGSRPWPLPMEPPRAPPSSATLQQRPNAGAGTRSGRVVQPQRPYFSHVFIDHLYQTRTGVPDNGFDTMSISRRVGSRIINTILIRSCESSSGPTSMAVEEAHPP